MGTGHAVRCLALAQAWQDAGGRPVFVMARPSSSTVQRISAETIEVFEMASAAGSLDDAKELASLSRRQNARWIVVDGYHFGAAYQRHLKSDPKSAETKSAKTKSAKTKLLLIDDMGKAAPYCADIVVNQNLHASENMYSHREKYTRLLLGSKYVMLRRNFTARRKRDRTFSDARRLLILMGGSDPDNLTAKILEYLKTLNLPGWEARAIIGKDSRFQESLRDTILRNKLPVELLENPPDVAEPMEWADLAISAGGTTIWELAFMGVPVIAIARAEQELMLIRAAAARDVVVDLGMFQSVDAIKIKGAVESLAHDSDRRRRMSEAGRALIDGRGASRIVSAMNEL
jgi:UDP-2,4-diacetamido-2,4,6-trideoxy-beta-L-altropyranose hydrolase